jgi:hypothetical protein
MPRFREVNRILNGNSSTTNRIAVADGGRGAIAMEWVRMAFGYAELLALNLEGARREEAGKSVIAPGEEVDFCPDCSASLLYWYRGGRAGQAIASGATGKWSGRSPVAV